MTRKRNNQLAERRESKAREVYRALVKMNAFGPARAVNAPDFADALGIEIVDGEAFGNGAGTKLRRRVASAVREGYLIASDARGYFLPRTVADGQPTIRSLEKKAFSMLLRASMMRELLVAAAEDAA